MFPGLVFPHPGVSDAIALSDAEWPVLLVVVAGASTAFAVFRGEPGVVVRAALGVFLLGVAAVLVLDLILFGNLSNDRFGPLILFRRSSRRMGSTSSS